MKAGVYLAALLVLSASASPSAGSEIIPDAFPIRNTSRYTIRYLSESGSDTASCLQLRQHLKHMLKQK